VAGTEQQAVRRVPCSAKQHIHVWSAHWPVASVLASALGHLACTCKSGLQRA
jgi:hypothetical protein